VTGVALFTYVAKYQGRVVVDNVLSRSRRAHYRGIPRVVFSDPEIAAVGLDAARAREEGIEVACAEVDLAQSISRPVTYEEEPRGTLGLVADRERGVLVGAWAVSPLASEWIHHAALAVRAEVPLGVLRDEVPQFPSYAEGYLAALEELEA
jgi:dihydrolipoamide dehydrogenase